MKMTAALTAAMLALPGLVPARAGDLEVRMVQGACVCGAAFSVALKEGFLDQELNPLHVKLTLARLETGPAQTAALQSGSLDIALYGAAAVALIANRLPVRFFMMADNPSGGEGPGGEVRHRFAAGSCRQEDRNSAGHVGRRDVARCDQDLPSSGGQDRAGEPRSHRRWPRHGNATTSRVRISGTHGSRGWRVWAATSW